MLQNLTYQNSFYVRVLKDVCQNFVIYLMFYALDVIFTRWDWSCKPGWCYSELSTNLECLDTGTFRILANKHITPYGPVHPFLKYISWNISFEKIVQSNLLKSLKKFNNLKLSELLLWTSRKWLSRITNFIILKWRRLIQWLLINPSFPAVLSLTCSEMLSMTDKPTRTLAVLSFAGQSSYSVEQTSQRLLIFQWRQWRSLLLQKLISGVVIQSL